MFFLFEYLFLISLWILLPLDHWGYWWNLQFTQRRCGLVALPLEILHLLDPRSNRAKDDFVGVWSFMHLRCLGLKFRHLTNGWPWGKSQGSWCEGFCTVKVGRALAPHQLDRKRSNNELNQVLAYGKCFVCLLWLRNNHTSIPWCHKVPFKHVRTYLLHVNVCMFLWMCIFTPTHAHPES